MQCRHCGAELKLPFVDLGTAPPSNAFLDESRLTTPENWYPLRVLVCESCWLVQTEDYVSANALFDADYVYFSSYSSSWLRHSEAYVERVTRRFGLGAASHVVEVAANDGYLLQYVRDRGVPCTGIEPCASTARTARARGIPVIERFFGRDLARALVAEGRAADLTVANNVLAHVPDINDFVAGFALLLKPAGVATFEFPHLLRLILEAQFDTIYHEHFSYLSLTAVVRIFRTHGLDVFDVEELPTHGGSLRVYAQRRDGGRHPVTLAVAELLRREADAGLTRRAGYLGFQERTDAIKNDFVAFLLAAKRRRRKVAGYGAAAKGNTFLNYAGVRRDLMPFVVDRSPSKQGKWLPGSRIPVGAPDLIEREKPDYVAILPWNLKDEIVRDLAHVCAWGGAFVVALPKLTVRQATERAPELQAALEAIGKLTGMG